MAAVTEAGDRLARFNAWVLAAAAALAGANASVVVATSGLVGRVLTGEMKLATVPVLTFVVGTAVSAFPAAFSMRRFGRRNGFAGGALFGVLAGVLGAVAIIHGSFLLFCIATFSCGAYQAFVVQYRFAAADTATPAYRPRVIALALGGGLAAAFVGPQLVIQTQDMWAPYLFAATYVAQAAFAAIAFFVLLLLRAPPLHEWPRGKGRPIGEILSDRRLVAAMLLGMVSQGVMNLVMTSTPLAMVGCGLPVASAAYAIQWHIIGMYAPSFVTGQLIARFGIARIGLVGCAIFVICGLVAQAGISVLHFDIALLLLGVGWNFAFLSATAAVTGAARPEERAKVQATNDVVVFGGTAFAAYFSGVLLGLFGWAGIAATVFPAAALGAMLILVSRRHSQRLATA
ncbi:Predicted arabinose efflux permease, MFS family [Rhizobiales bacterium GAS191]|nr:Predicted arabinose efflux permease, MFS family [Rhizobiales bacterium GAS191]